MSSLELGEGLQTIKAYAFSGLSKLSLITLPSTLTKIEQYAFYNTNNSELIVNYKSTIEKWLEVDNEIVFINNPHNLVYSAKEFNVFNGENFVKPTAVNASKINKISPFALYNMSSITSIIVTGVKEIGDYAFMNCSGIKKLVISDFVDENGIEPSFILTYLGEGILKNCKNIYEISIPFYGADNTNADAQFSRIFGGSGVTETTESETPWSLKKVSITGSTIISEGAFLNEIAIKYIQIEGVQTKIIEDYAFTNCYSLLTLDIPASVESVNNNSGSMFVKTYSLAEIYNRCNLDLSHSSAALYYETRIYTKKTTNLKIVNDFVFLITQEVDDDGNDIIYLVDYVGDSKNIKLPEYYTGETGYYLHKYTFLYTTNVQTLIIPATVKEIKNYSFNTELTPSIEAIYCEATSKPTSWESSWAGNCMKYFYSETEKSNRWHYDNDGVTPVLWVVA